MEEAGGVLEVRCISFGFRWGAPPPRVVQRFNLRGLENPPSSMLKRLTGLDKDLQKEVFAFKKTQNLYEEHVHTICQHIERFMMLHNQEADEDATTNAKEEEEEEEEEEGGGGEGGEVKYDDEEEDREEGEEDEEEGDDDGEEEEDRHLIMAFGFGCQRGRHRSVAFVERLSKEPRFHEAFCAIAARLKHEACQPEQGHQRQCIGTSAKRQANNSLMATTTTKTGEEETESRTAKKNASASIAALCSAKVVKTMLTPRRAWPQGWWFVAAPCAPRRSGVALLPRGWGSTRRSAAVSAGRFTLGSALPQRHHLHSTALFRDAKKVKYEEEEEEGEGEDREEEGEEEGEVGVKGGKQRSSSATKKRVTPAMAQYFKVKQENPGFLLLFRIGDFYEMFYEDAVKASALLDITLTKRDKTSGIPMCGIPYHALDTYLEKFIKKGVMVAVCDQTEDVASAKKRKSVVKREVTRLVTPGTLVEDRFLQPRQHNYLVSIARNPDNDTLALAWLDLSTGDFTVSTTYESVLEMDLARLLPGELLVEENLFHDTKNGDKLKNMFKLYHTTPLPSSAFSEKTSKDLFKKAYSDKHTQAKQILSAFSDLEVNAAGALLYYVQETQKGRLPQNMSLPSHFSSASTMAIDPHTRRSLELTRSLLGNQINSKCLSFTSFNALYVEGERKGSLLAIMDKTVTPSGARLLASQLNSPLLDIQEINERLDTVDFFVLRPKLIKKVSFLPPLSSLVSYHHQQLQELLKECYDMERCLQRISLAKGSPRDLAAIASTLQQARVIRQLLCSKPYGADLPHHLQSKHAERALCPSSHENLVALLSKALVADIPSVFSNGEFIAPGFSAELDEIRKLRDSGTHTLKSLQQQYRIDLGIPKLKVKSNNIIGHFVEVPIAEASKLEKSKTHFAHCQTLTAANVSRYKTDELTELESRVKTAANDALQLEMRLFEELCLQTLTTADTIRTTSAALAQLDVSSSLAALANEYNYVRPSLSEEPTLKIVGGRHPIVEAAQRQEQASSFTPNDCDLNSNSNLWLLTGPNMGGKSTFLRQNALITIMAQMGSFVPAQSAQIGIVDSVFSRVGASDDLARDRSTFMNEMIETSLILKHATPRSLVIMDEIGRGTSTLDGLSIAWAVIEHIHNELDCRTLFATHYLELAELKNTLQRLSCRTLAASEQRGGVLFLHKVVPGVAPKSYGIQVAELAGLPPSVCNRARKVLKHVDKS
ncbi:DNA mismatch repair protein MutS, variant 2 [Balamuthia mandrillaris]